MADKFDGVYKNQSPAKNDKCSEEKERIKNPISNKRLGESKIMVPPLQIWDPMETRSRSICIPR